MSSPLIKVCAAAALCIAPLMSLAQQVDSVLVDSALEGSNRSEASTARDSARHPAETLAFFGVSPTDKVVEISPGGGWYTEILAPYLYGEGQFFAAHFPSDSDTPYYQRSRQAFVDKMASDSAAYGHVKVSQFVIGKPDLAAPLGAVDKVLTFRNVHNWIKAGNAEQAFKDFYALLAGGGVLGVVEHRAKAGTAMAVMQGSGYVTEAEVIRLAVQAGFVLEAKSELNANPKDSKDHPKGVWTLPPTLVLQDEDRDKYLAIGESDRMTLRFRKPE